MTPWPIRFTREPPLGSRISAPARFSESLPRLRGWRLTVMAGSLLIPWTTSIW